MSAAARPSRRSTGRAFADALSAELLKLVTLPPLWLTVVGTLGVAVVLGAAFTTAAADGRTGTTAVLDVGLAPVGYTQAGMIVLGILATSSEYSGGQIRTTLTAVPRRLLLQAARTVALALVAVPVAAADVLLGVATARIVLGGTASTGGATHPVTAVAGAVAYLVLVTTIAAAVGAVVRRSLPALVTLLGYFFIVGPLVRDRVAASAYLPDTAGYRLWFPGGADATEPLGRVGSGAVVVLWTFLAVAAATATFRRRDA